MQWKRGGLSFLFIGGEGEMNGDIYIIDQDDKIYDNLTKKTEEVDDLSLQRDCHQLMMLDKLQRVNITTKNSSFEPQKSWLGYLKTEKIDGYNCDLYTLKGLALIHTTRKSKSHVKGRRRKRMTEEDYVFTGEEEYFQPGEKNGLLFKDEKINKKERPIKPGSVHFAENFPITVDTLLPIIELLSPSARHFKKLEDILKLKMPEGRFPVKIQLPIVPTVSAIVSIGKYREDNDEMKIDEGLFKLPEGYKKGPVKLIGQSTQQKGEERKEEEKE